jgi:hypothetical protein
MTDSTKPPSTALRIETFPGLRIVRADGKNAREVPIPVGEKPGVLLVLLALAGDTGIPRATVRTLLWPDTSDANGSNSLRQALFRLRRALGAESVEDRAGRLYLRLPIALDVVEAAQRLDGGDLAGALDIISTPFGHTLDVAGPALREWLQRYRHQLDLRLEGVIRASWSPDASGAMLAMLQSAVPIVRRILPTSVDLLWIQLELDARHGDAVAFERHLQELRTLQRGTPVDPGDATRLAALRQRLSAGAATPQLRPPSLHEEALRTIQRHLANATQEGGVLWVTGPSGIGRSHLLRELARRAVPAGFRVVQLGPGDAVPGLPTSCCRDLAVALSALRGAAGLDPRFAPIVERLARGTLHPRTDEAAEAVLDLAVAVVAEGPLLLLIDDAERYEGRELQTLLATLDDQRPRRLLTIVSAPPHTVPTRLAAAPIALAPLRREDVRQMVDELATLPDTPWGEALVDGLEQASGGIPRRILHLLATLHREGLLLERQAGWALGGSVDGLRARLGQLAPNGALP